MTELNPMDKMVFHVTWGWSNPFSSSILPFQPSKSYHKDHRAYLYYILFPTIFLFPAQTNVPLKSVALAYNSTLGHFTVHQAIHLQELLAVQVAPCSTILFTYCTSSASWFTIK